jgi:hypothetical protein
MSLIDYGSLSILFRTCWSQVFERLEWFMFICTLLSKLQSGYSGFVAS